jgi:integrase
MGIHDKDIYVRLPRTENKIRAATYLEDNKTAILDFENYLYAQGIGALRILDCITTLHRYALDTTKPFKEMTRTDVQAIVAGIERSDLAESSKQHNKSILKKFFRYLQGEQNAASWVKTSVKLSSKKLPEDLFTEDEVKMLIEAVDNPRDKALISVLFDSGCRVGEIGDLRIKNIIFDEYGGIINVTGKTGARRVRLMFSMSAIADWLDYHPQKQDKEAYVFVNVSGPNKGKQMRHSAIDQMIKKAAKKIGMEKRVHPHLFRHSRATMYAQHLTEAQMEMNFGWIHGSKMSGTYVHLSGKQIDDAILGIYGKKKKEDVLPELMSITCPRCKKDNGPTSSFCVQCGLPLNLDAMQEAQTSQEKLMHVIEMIMRNDEIRSMLDEV